MAKLLINDDDFSGNLTGFNLNCKECGSNKVILDVVWATYSDGASVNFAVICKDCRHQEAVYSS